MSQDKMFQAIQDQSQEILFSKEQDIKNLTVRILKQELDLKLKNISEKPNDILKRLDKFADLPKVEAEGKGMFCFSVIVRVFEKELEILRDELEQQKLDE